MRKLRWRLAAAVFLAALPVARAERTLIDGVAAFVNEHPITVSDVMGAAAPVRRQFMASLKGRELEEKSRQAYADATESLIGRRLILDFQKQKEMKIPDWLVEQRIDEIVRENFSDDRNTLMEALSRDHLSIGEWRETVREQILVSYLRQMHVDARVEVSPVAIRRVYDERIAEFRTPGRLRVRMITLGKGASPEAVEARRRVAEDLRRRAAGGEDFARLARDASEDSRARDGGDWGWIESRTLRAELARVADRLKPGEVSQVVETDDSLYLVKVDGRQEEKLLPYATVAPRIERELRRARSERLHKGWVQRLRDRSCIRINDVELRAGDEE